MSTLPSSSQQWFGLLPNPLNFFAAPPLNSTIVTTGTVNPPPLTTPPQTTTITSIPLHQEYSTHPNQNHFQTIPYRPQKVDLPRFMGEDALGWLAMAQRYLCSQRVPLHEYMTTVASHFGPDACMWINSFEEGNPGATWEYFASSFLEHYGAGNVTDIQTTLSHLQQTGYVDEFIGAFTKLSSRAYGWSEIQLLPSILGGLKP